MGKHIGLTLLKSSLPASFTCIGRCIQKLLSNARIRRGRHSGEAIVEKLKDICPDYDTMTIQFAFGEVIEVIYQTALYAGFAAATNAMFIAKEVFSKYETQPKGE